MSRLLISILSKSRAVVFAVMLLGVALNAAALEITSPQEGEVVPLLTEAQRAYVKTPRDVRETYFADNTAKRAELRRIGSKPNPVHVAWTGAGAEPVTVTIRRLPSNEQVYSFCGRTNALEVVNLEIAREYVCEVASGGEKAMRRFRTEDLAPRFMDVPNIGNMRDLGGRRGLGGRRVKQGLIYRSAGWNSNAVWAKKKVPGKKKPVVDESVPPTSGTNRLTAAGRAYAFGTLKIRSDIDLRKDSECWGMTGSPIGPEVTWFHYSYLGYYETDTKAGRTAFAKVFRVMLDEKNYPLVFHCIGGADRTGTVAFILNALLGCAEEELFLDWEVTGFTGGIVDARHRKWFKGLVRTIGKHTGATWAEKAADYVRTCGFTDADIAKFRALMLDGSANAPAVAEPKTETPKKVALDADDDARPADADKSAFPARRILPIDPELANVDPAKGELTFYVPDQLPGTAWTIVATMDGRKARAPLGADRRATVRFGALAEGQYDLKVRLVAEADGRELLANEYPVRVRAKPVMPASAKRLNNFVWELGEFPVMNGKVAFTNPRDGWVFLRSGKSEVMRYLPAGPCAIEMPGTSCRVRLIKDLHMGGYACCPYVFDYATPEFLRKWVFPNFTSFSIRGIPTADDATSAEAQNYRELRRRGAQVSMSARMRVGDKALFGNVDRMLKLMEAVGGKGERDALGVDEMRMDLKGANNRNFGDAIWRYLEKYGYGEPINTCWCNVIDNEMTLPAEVAPSLSAVMHSGNGRGMILTEHYLCARDSWKSAAREIEMVVKFSQSLRRLSSVAPAHISYLLGGYLIPGDWTSWCSPDPDMKAYFALFMRRLATDPEFADAGGVSFSRFYCDEEIARFAAALMRYYAIEGHTDDLNEKLGYRYFPKYVSNGDFQKKFRGWTAEPAADGSLFVTNKVDYGRRLQHRIGGGKCGDTFALFVRQAARPNLLRRTVKGLTPGKKYSLSFVTADYDDLLKPGTRPTNTVFHATLANADIVPEKSYVTVWPPEYFSPGGRRQKRTVTLGHKIVFTACGTETEIVFTDWKSDRESGGRIGERRLLNNVGFYPYFDEDSL